MKKTHLEENVMTSLVILLQKSSNVVTETTNCAVLSIVPGAVLSSRSLCENKMECLVQILLYQKWIIAVAVDRQKLSSHSYVLSIE